MVWLVHCVFTISGHPGKSPNRGLWRFVFNYHFKKPHRFYEKQTNKPFGREAPERQFEILTPGAKRQKNLTPGTERPKKTFVHPQSYHVVSYRIAWALIVMYRIALYRVVPHRIASYRIASYRSASYRGVSYCTVLYRIVSFRSVSCACGCVLVPEGALAFVCACVGAFACICACVCAFSLFFLHRSQGPSLIFPRDLASSFPGT